MGSLQMETKPPSQVTSNVIVELSRSGLIHRLSLGRRCVGQKADAINGRCLRAFGVNADASYNQRRTMNPKRPSGSAKLRRSLWEEDFESWWQRADAPRLS